MPMDESLKELTHTISPYKHCHQSPKHIGNKYALTPVHTLLAMAINPPVLKQINRLIRNFLCYGRKDTRSGYCLINRRQVCHPTSLGGLGLLDLHRMGISLRARWLGSKE